VTAIQVFGLVTHILRSTKALIAICSYWESSYIIQFLEHIVFTALSVLSVRMYNLIAAETSNGAISYRPNT
jgi:Na+/phosphate symporter